MQFSVYSFFLLSVMCMVNLDYGADQQLASREERDLAYAKSALAQLIVDYPDLEEDASLGPKFREWFLRRIAGKSEFKNDWTGRVIFIPTEPFNGETSMTFIANGPIPTIVLLSRNRRRSGFEKWVLICLELERADRSDAWNGLMEKLETTQIPEAEFISKGWEFDYESLIATKRRLHSLDLQSKTKGNQSAETQIDRIPDNFKKFTEEVGRGEHGEFNRRTFFQLQYQAIRQHQSRP